MQKLKTELEEKQREKSVALKSLGQDKSRLSIHSGKKKGKKKKKSGQSSRAIKKEK